VIWKHWQFYTDNQLTGGDAGENSSQSQQPVGLVQRVQGMSSLLVWSDHLRTNKYSNGSSQRYLVDCVSADNVEVREV